MKNDVFPLVTRYYPLAIAFSLILAIIYAILQIIVIPEDLNFQISNAFLLVINFINVIGMWTASKVSSSFSKRTSRTFLLWAIAYSAVLIGDMAWSFYPIISPPDTTPLSSVAIQAVYLAFHPLIFIGGLMIPLVAMTRLTRIKRLLESLVILLCVFIVYWIFLLNPAYSQMPSDVSSDPLVFYVYTISSSLLIILLIRFRDCDFNYFSQLSTFFFTCSILLYIVCDGYYSYQFFMMQESSTGWLEFGWMLAYALAGIAAMNQNHLKRVGSRYDAFYEPFRKFVRGLYAAFPYLPYLLLALGYYFLIQTYNFHGLSTFREMSIVVGCIILLDIIRLVIEYSENNHLNKRLSQSLNSLEQKQSELAQINDELKIENQERRQVEGRLAFNAMHDWLTGLPNRVLFLDRLTQAIEYCRRSDDICFSVMFLDLDQFKVINDSMGHDAGDSLLISVSKKLLKCIRNSDTLARLGGDEFVFLLENTSDEASINLVIDRIYQEFAEPLIIHDQMTFVTASIGVVRDINEYKSAEDILRDADIAMYRAKELGKSQAAYFEPDMRSKAITRLEVENDLRTALKENQFFLHYQPIIDVGENAPVGFEALVRWQHPTRGLVPPNQFIQVAEETGLIIQIGEWVLREACWQVVRWQKNIPNMQQLFINVNISGKQFATNGFVDLIQKILSETKLDPHCLKLEITESVLIENIGNANTIFTYLENLGIQFEIDDFGTGYSSISYLQHLPIHTIKIDKSFVHDVAEGSRGIELIQAMIAMADNLGMETIAEGVETQEQLDKLSDLNCSFVQGFLLAHPMDRYNATEYLKKQNSNG